MPLLEIRELTQKFKGKKILSDLNLTVNSGETLVIVGKSGAGKTTLLRCLDLLEQPTSGHLTLGEKTFDYRHLTASDIRSIRDQLAMVFQNYALFNNKTALENITEPLIYGQHQTKSNAKKIAETLLAQLELTDKANLYPAELSGGQQQRIGIARSEALRPSIILFDEPTSSLDPALVGTITRDILSLRAKGQTMIVVTHQLDFAQHIATKCAFLHEGNLVEVTPAEQFFKHPSHQETAAFLKAASEEAQV